jgi:ferredoxin
MKVKVDEDLCLGCGICEGLAPDVFSMANEPFAEVLVDVVPAEMEDDVRQAAEECPEEAILIEE